MFEFLRFSYSLFLFHREMRGESQWTNGDSENNDPILDNSHDMYRFYSFSNQCVHKRSALFIIDRLIVSLIRLVVNYPFHSHIYTFLQEIYTQPRQPLK